MTVQTDNVQTEVKTQNSTQPNTEATKAQPQTQQKQESPPIKSEENQENWKKFREQRDSERKQLAEAQERANKQAQESAALKAALEAVVNKPSPQQNHQYEDNEETDDQRIEKKVQAALAKHRQNEVIERQRKDAEELPQRLSSTHSDFNAVCSTENLDYLEFHYPEVASAYKQMPDTFDKWNNVYKAIKRFVPNIDGKKEMAKAERNLQKPQSMSAPGATQGGSAMPGQRLDQKKKDENWARMQRTIKGLS